MTTHLNFIQKELLAREIKSWQHEAIISDGLAETLLDRYRHDLSIANAGGFLTLTGSILIGLGSLLFIAANWQSIGVLVKLALILLAIVLSHYLGWRLHFEPGRYPKLGAGLLVAGCLFFGGAIWLIAQIFNLDLDTSTGLLIWAVGSLSSAYVTRVVPLGCLSALLLGVWAILDKSFSIEILKAFGHLPQILAAGTVSLLLAHYLRSRSVTWIALLSGGVSLLTWFNDAKALILWGVACLAGYLLARDKRPWSTAPFLYAGSCSMLLYLYFMTLSASSISSSPKTQIGMLMCASLAVLLLAGWKLAKARLEIGAMIILAVLSCLTLGYGEGPTKILSNIYLLVATGGLASAGLYLWRSRGAVNVAIAFFVLDIIARYFDFFFTMMDRSLFFIVGGIVLLTAGTLAEKSRRRLLESIPETAAAN